MSSGVAILILIGYLLIGLFISAVFNDDGQPLLVAFWPFVIVAVIIVKVLSLVVEAGHWVGKRL